MLGDDTGAFKSRTDSANIAIAGGILMELALLGRIDADLTSLFIVDPQPVGDELLDRALAEIAAEPTKKSSSWWIERFGLRKFDLWATVLGRLVEAGILFVKRIGNSSGGLRVAPILKIPDARSGRRRVASCPLFSMTPYQIRATL